MVKQELYMLLLHELFLQIQHCTVGMFTVISRIQTPAMASPPLMSLAIVQTWFDFFFFFFLFVWWNKGWAFFFFFIVTERGWVFGELLSYEKSQASDWRVLTFELTADVRTSHFPLLCRAVQVLECPKQGLFSFSCFCYLWRRFHSNWVLNVKNSCFKVVTQVPLEVFH